MMQESIGSILRNKRELIGFSPEDVLGATGVSIVYLSRLEGDELKTVSASVLYKLADLYRMELKPLLILAGVIIKKSDANNS